MSSDGGNSGNPLLDKIIAEYMQQSQAGNPPDRQLLLDEHPELAAELKSFFAGHDQMRNAAGRNLEDATLRPQPVAEDATRPPTPGGEDRTIPPGAADAASTGTKVRYFGDYELLEEIARGGMGVVYKARQVSLNRIVALKMILSGQLASSDDVKRFHVEAEAAANLDHAGIVPIFEVGEWKGQHYYSMGYVEGESLAERLKAGPLAPREAVELMREIATAVAFAHRHGVIHRDLKPANVLLQLEDAATEKSDEDSQAASARPRVTDFGLAKRVATDSDLTASGQILGTPSYMPPEQAAGKLHEVRETADVYSLGAILYACLTGRPPFQAHSPLETLIQVGEQEPAAPRELNPQIPRDVETICLKCLEKEPARRYRSAQALYDELDRVLNDEPIRARPPGFAERAWRWLRKQGPRAAISVGAIATVLVIAGLSAAILYSYHRWRLGYLTIGTDTPGLVAEIFDSDGNVAAPARTLPTTAALRLPTGDYRVRVSGEGRLSQTYFARVPARERTKLRLNLEDQLIWPSREIEGSYALSQVGGHAAVVLLNDEGLELLAPQTGQRLWYTDILEGLKNVAPPGQVGWVAWRWQLPAIESGRGEFDHRPWLVPTTETNAFPDTGELSAGLDLNSDNHADFIVASRIQAWLAAVSGKDGTLLWFAPRGSDLQVSLTAADAHVQQSDRVQSSVLAPPEILSDIDDDGIADLLVTIADIGDESARSAKRWFEAISGKTGLTIWKQDLDDEWFTLKGGEELPGGLRWFNKGARSLQEGTNLAIRRPDIIRTTRPKSDREGQATYAPTAARFLPAAPGEGHFGRVVVIAGRHLVVTDAATGIPVSEPIDTKVRPFSQPKLADVDGDGTRDLILIEKSLPQGGPVMTRLVAWSVAKARVLWERMLDADVPQRFSRKSPLPHWPVAADVDGDGHAELLVPNGRFSHTSHRGWMDASAIVELLDGSTGDTRWKRQLKHVDLQLDHFTFGPDVDDDGYREVFVATLQYTKTELFVDCLSGRDGSRIWWSRAELDRETDAGYAIVWAIGRLDWWTSGNYHTPSLVVQIYGDGHRYEPSSPIVTVFSSDDGRVMGQGSDMELGGLADVDGDGSDDLVAYRPYRELDRGGTLDVLRNSSQESWRRLSPGSWQATADVNRDGVADLLQPSSERRLQAISGATGRSLWSERSLANATPQAHVTADINRDGVLDLFISPGGTTWYPDGRRWRIFRLLSGRSGKPIWSADVKVGSFEGLRFFTCRNINGDAVEDIAVVAQLTFEGASASGGEHLRLIVLDGSTGEVLWGTPLAAPGQPMPKQRVDVAFADLDGDGNDEVITPAFSSNARSLELKALDGLSGNPFWSRTIEAAPADGGDLAQVAVLAADLDGNGESEVCVLELSGPRLTVLNGADGTPRWRWKPESNLFVRPSWSPTSGLSRRLMLLRVAREAKSLICLNFDGYPGGALVLDSEGREAWRYSLRGPDEALGTWVLDVDGDGGDELLVRDGNRLLLAQPGLRSSSPYLWQQEIPTAGDAVHLLPAGQSGRSRILLVEHKNQGSILGIQAASGRRVLSVKGPQPFFSREQRRVEMMSLSTTATHLSGLPVAFQYQTGLNENYVSIGQQLGLGGAGQGGGSSASSRSAADLDPRSTRDLPWVAAWELPEEERAEVPILIIWTSLVSLLIVVAPGLYTVRLLRSFRWSLATFLVLPAVVALVIVGLSIPPPMFEVSLNLNLGSRVLIAFGAAPWLLFVGWLIIWSANRRWLRIVLWSVAAAVISLVPAAVMIMTDHRWSAVETRYDWEGWYIVLAFGVYACGLLMLPAAAIEAISRSFRRWRRERGN